MNIDEQRKAFEDWHFIDWKLQNAVTDTFDFAKALYERVYSHNHTAHIRDLEFKAWLASANRDGYKLVPNNDINITDVIWGKCPCGSSMSPIISDKVGYNLIHCFACGANKYIHKDY